MNSFHGATPEARSRPGIDSTNQTEVRRVEVSVTARSCELPAALIRQATRQVARLSRYHPRAVSAEVIFSEKKREKEVEVVVNVHKTPTIVAKGEARDFRSALDEVVERVARMLRKQRERARDHRAEGLPGAVL